MLTSLQTDNVTPPHCATGGSSTLATIVGDKWSQFSETTVAGNGERRLSRQCGRGL